MIPVSEIVFYIFSTALVVSSLCVILQRSPVRSVLSLVMCFVSASVLWMLVQAEFLSLVLIFVYVGAVMTLFLFVVMMLNVNVVKEDRYFVRYVPVGIFVMLAFLAAILYCLTGKNTPEFLRHLPSFPAGTNNTVDIGMSLYTTYLLPLEICSAILLVAMIAAIAIAFHGPSKGTKAQRAADQVAVKASDRLKIIPMKSEKK